MSNAIVEIHRSNHPPEKHNIEQGTWIIGREKGDLVINDPQVSGRHGQLDLKLGNLRYTDLGSTNGSFLVSNGQRLTAPVELKEGDGIRLGNSTINILSIPPVAKSASGTVLMSQSIESAKTDPAPPAPVQAQASEMEMQPSIDIQPSAPIQKGTPDSVQDVQPSSENVWDETSSTFSHPDQQIRHSYPLSIRDASLGTAMGLVMKTLPYALARFGILVAFSLVTIIWFIITFGGAAFLAKKVNLLGWIWGTAGMAVYGWAWWFVIRYFLYLLKAGHIAVLTELITKNNIANGQQGMFQYGTEVVKSRFGQVNAMFALDLLIHGVVRAFNRTLDFVASLLPIPGLSSVMGIVNSIIYAATTYVDETMFSYNLARGDTNIWRSSRDGLVYYAQNSKEVLKTGIWIVLLDKVLSVVVWVVMLVPAFIISYLLPSSLANWGTLFIFGIAILFASNFRGAFLKPLFLVMVMTKFHVCVENQPIDESWDERLTSASNKFQEIKNKALSTGSATSQPASA